MPAPWQENPNKVVVEFRKGNQGAVSAQIAPSSRALTGISTLGGVSLCRICDGSRIISVLPSMLWQSDARLCVASHHLHYHS